MSLIPRLLWLYVCFLLLSAGCRKDPASGVVSNNPLGLAKGLGSDCAEGVKLVCGMPYYQNAAHFEQAYQCLDEAYEDHQDDFELAYGGLSEDDYEAMVGTLGWVDEEPLLEFETASGYTSYRTNMSSLEDAWLAAGASGPNPWSSDVFVDEVLSTMFNKDGAAMIGDVIVYYAPNGDIYHIPSADEDCSLYDCLLNGPENCVMDSVEVIKAGTTSICGELYAVEDSTEFYYNDGERRVDWNMKHNRVGGIENRFVYRSEIRAYKKKNGNWKKRRTKLAVKIDGTAYYLDIATCKEDDETLNQDPKRRKVRRNKRNFFPSYVDFAVTDEIMSSKFHFTGNEKVDRLDL